MRGKLAFWDSSALVPLCVQQPTSPQARSYFRQYTRTVWWATTVEIYGAIARLHRTGILDEKEHIGARLRVRQLSTMWIEIAPDEDVRQLAMQLLAQHRLRAADSLQLAAALVWCYERPKQRFFLSGDQRLSEAAESVGFSVVSL